MSAKVSLWTLLPDSPIFSERIFLASMNNTELLVVAWNILWKYDCTTHKWAEIMKIIMNIPLNGSVMFDKDTQSLYFCNVFNQLFKVDIKTKQEILLVEHPNFTSDIMFKNHDSIHCISLTGSNDIAYDFR